MKRLFETAVLLVVSAPAVMWAQTLTVQQDSFYAPGSASNYGTLPTIDVGGASSFYGLVQFDLSVLPNGTAGAQVSKATLSLFVDKVGAPGLVNIDVANYPWTEIAVNGINPPAAGAAILDGISIGTASAGSYLTVDVTQAVKNWLDHLAQNNGFLISPGNPAVSVFFDSKENTSTSHPASLSITLLGPAGPAGPTGATGPAGPQGPSGTGFNILQAGSALAPSLSFVGNSNTGLFSATANTVNIATNGVSHLQVGQTGDLDFTGNLTQAGILLARVAGSANDFSTAFGIGNLASGPGDHNTAIGAKAMTANSTGHDNTALGAQALTHVKTGLHNTALGSTALTSAIGNDNVAIGFGAGSNLNVGDQNIYIANTGQGNESGAIRIGTNGAQNAAFIAGVRGITPAAGNGLPVVIDSNGQLGTVSSISGPAGPQGPIGPIGPAGPSSLAGMFTSVRIDYNLPGGGALGGFGWTSLDATCPSDHPILVSGGCGHRDNNEAQTDLNVNYTGPDPNGGQFWHCLLTDDSPSSRAVVAYAICSK